MDQKDSSFCTNPNGNRDGTANPAFEWSNGDVEASGAGAESQNRQSNTTCDPYLDKRKDTKEITHPTSNLETLIHLLKGNIGTGMMAMGDAFRNAGLVAGTVITLILGVICVHSQHLLLKSSFDLSARTKRDINPDFADVVEMSFATGPQKLRKFTGFMRSIVNIFLCLTQLGFCCIYFVFISENIQQVVDQYYSPSLDLHLYMFIFLAPILLTTWINNLKYLAPVSFFATVLNIFAVGTTIYLSSVDLPPVSSRNSFSSWSQLPLYFGTVIFCFEGIGLVLPLQREMKKPEDFGGHFGILNIGMVIVGALLITLGFVGYTSYGEGVQGSLSLNLDPNEKLPQCVKVALSISVLFSYALQFYVPVEIMWPRLREILHVKKYPYLQEMVFRTILCVITFGFAEAIPKLGLFISLVGAFSSSILALILPPIVEIVTYWETGLGRWHWKLWKDIFIMLVGILGFATGSYSSIMSIVEAFKSDG